MIFFVNHNFLTLELVYNSYKTVISRSAPRLPQTRSICTSFWDDAPLVLGRSAQHP